MYIAVQSNRQNSIRLAKSEFKIDQIYTYANNLNISYCVNIQWYSFCFRFD